MRTPTIHLNGTSAEVLLDGVQKALVALDIASTQIRNMAPQPQDYYPQGYRDAFYDASYSHSQMLAKIASVRHEIYGVYEGILDQQED